ncbi:probable receptor-like protein kinase At5g59700 [Elaeis guineensis]|uniref:Probable receptor-like protein kinase At5g59700 n=1 Tax=Elaeis guineensis var. tenera TaxID=51953 RepID=A0A6I9RBP5_ELAGV|nr:probable receptor-like protein kinase At5g59700 [Elaeis guineensis]XP_010920749.1 probable receptor-like protein kinase At5g59700 [Elaeis guineensis]
MMGIGKLGLGFCILVAISLQCVCGSFTPVDNYLIDCGSSNSSTMDNRTFVADASSSSTLTAPNSISASTSSSSVSALYQTARIFREPSSYSFSIQNHGWHFIRLHFFPFVYQSYNLMTSKFTVSIQDFDLLQNFQPQGNSSPELKEYLVNVNEDTLYLSFIPVGNSSFAFINAVEVFSAPDDLVNDSARTVNPSGEYQGLLGQALETVYRINMGGPEVTPDSDTLWRTWVNDSSFIVTKSFAKSVSFSGQLNYQQGQATQETAPNIVYSTATRLVAPNTSAANANVTWQFNVDTNSSYFIRLHFCDIVSKALVDLYFNVYIRSWVVLPNFDLSAVALSLAAPYYVDFVLAASDVSSKLHISIGRSSLRYDSVDGILNGLEIMKIRDSNASAMVIAPPGSKKKLGVILGSAVGAIAVVIVAFIFFMVCRRRKLARKHHSKTWMPFSVDGLTSQSTGSRTSNGTAATSGQNVSLGYRFTFIALQEATNNFDDNWVIGVGGFGKVYRGVLRDETMVAVKRGNPKSQQGLNEFRTEIELLSRLRHRHLVSLIGYCDERNEMILVYEYMEKGTLKSHLYGSDLPSLSWKQRLEICIGSARGLHYLHTAFAKAIIHRDVKSANILLDENLMAKVADFGLSKTGPDLDQTHVSTAVKGSFGYLDPEYFRRQQLTEKSDVYSFGVVLLEVLCARPVIDPTLPREMVNLAEWAMKWQKGGELKQIVDPRIAGTIRPDSLRKFGETVEKCLADYGVERPTMGDVLWNLEYVLQLQEAESGTSEVNSINRIAELSSQVQNIGNLESASVRGVGSSSSKDLSDVSMSQVFSQLIKAEGR